MLKLLIGELFGSFLLGLGTPLTAVCVLPLYPGFLSYLSRQFTGDESREAYAFFGILVVSGVMSFMLLLGLVFSAFLRESLTGVIGIVSPVAFGLLGILSLSMIFDLNMQSRFSFSAPEFENPLLNAYGFGFFFGAIVIPCNPGFISVFFARAFLFESPASSFLNFGMFGVGIGFPLLVFSIASARWSKKVIGILQNHETRINKASGLFMLGISIYYLVWVFNVLGIK